MVLDRKGYASAILIDLLKAFDTLNHDILIAKIAAYGFSEESLKSKRSYLTNRWQRPLLNSKVLISNTTQKKKFNIKDFFSKCNQIRFG